MIARKARVRVAAGGDPKSLEQAEDMLRRQRPMLAASADQWRAFHENAEQVYRAVADLDADHHFEALALASLARDDAEKASGATGAEKPG